MTFERTYGPPTDEQAERYKENLTQLRKHLDELKEAAIAKKDKASQTPEFPDWIAESTDRDVDPNQLNELSESVGWEARSAEEWQRQLEEPGAVMSLWDMDSLVGFGRMVIDENDEPLLCDGMIAPAYQHQGLFKTMLAKAETTLRDEGYKEIHLNEYPGTEEMYRHLGWNAVSTSSEA